MNSIIAETGGVFLGLPTALLGSGVIAGIVSAILTNFFTASREFNKRIADLRALLYHEIVECVAEFDAELQGGNYDSDDLMRLRKRWADLTYRMDLLASKETLQAFSVQRENVFSVLDNKGFLKVVSHWQKDRDSLIACMRSDLGLNEGKWKKFW